ADLFLESQRIKYPIEIWTRDIADARTYLLTLHKIGIKNMLYTVAYDFAS
ncbi:hypothetical protein ACH5RR_034229, partial [Cinchona calisaya]